jgi:hypothetical protein
MNNIGGRLKRVAVAGTLIVLVSPGLVACDMGDWTSCDSISTSIFAGGGRGGSSGGGSKTGKSTTSKTGTSGTTTKKTTGTNKGGAGWHGHSDDCDDD